MIGLSVDESGPDEVRQFVKKAGINYPVIISNSEIERKFGGVLGLPTMFVINRDGGLVQKHIGLSSPTLYGMEVKALLGMPVDAKIETFEDNGQIFLANAAKATSLPGVDFSKLTTEQKRAALKRMNSEGCNCGCRMTVAECRVNDSNCAVSQGMADKIVTEAGGGAATKPASKTEKN